MGPYDDNAYTTGSRYPTIRDDKDLSNYMDHAYQFAYPANSAYQTQAQIDLRFKTGDQSLDRMLYGSSRQTNAKRLSFNILRRHVNMISGYQRKNRKSLTVLPNQQNDQLSEEYSTVLKYIVNRNNFNEVFSDSFESSTALGLNLMHFYPDYTNDPFSGDIFCDSVAYSNFIIDPYFRKQDLTDCSFIWRRRWVNKQQAKALLPDRAKEIDKIKPVGAKDGKFPLQAELVNLQQSDLMTYDEFHYRTTRKATLILDTMTGEAIEWEKDMNTAEENAAIENMMQTQPWMRTQEVDVPTVRLGIRVGTETLYHGPNLLNIDQYPFAPNICYYEPDLQMYTQRIMGVIRNARDAQYLYNRRKVIELQILESQPTSGWVFPTDAVTDPKAFRQTAEGILIPLKPGHLPNEIQRLEAPQVPQSMIELSNMLGEDITRIIGTNEELLGSAEDDKAGILSMMRQGAGLTTLQGIFDRADFCMRQCGKILMEAARKNFTKGKVSNILGHEPDYRFFTSVALKYNVEVEEGNYTATQRQTSLQQKLYLTQLGLPIPIESIIKDAYFSDKKEVMASIEQQQQQQQMMQQQEAEKQAMQEQQEAARREQEFNADMMMKFAEAREKMASTDEKEAMVGERHAEAAYKRTEADLNLLKEMLTLEQMDLATLEKALKVIKTINGENNGERVNEISNTSRERVREEL